MKTFGAVHRNCCKYCGRARKRVPAKARRERQAVLNPGQVQVLYFVIEHVCFKGCTPSLSAIAAAMSIPRTTAQSRVDGLIRFGLLARSTRSGLLGANEGSDNA